MRTPTLGLHDFQFATRCTPSDATVIDVALTPCSEQRDVEVMLRSGPDHDNRAAARLYVDGSTTAGRLSPSYRKARSNVDRGTDAGGHAACHRMPELHVRLVLRPAAHAADRGVAALRPENLLGSGRQHRRDAVARLDHHLCLGTRTGANHPHDSIASAVEQIGVGAAAECSQHAITGLDLLRAIELGSRPDHSDDARARLSRHIDISARSKPASLAVTRPDVIGLACAAFGEAHQSTTRPA